MAETLIFDGNEWIPVGGGGGGTTNYNGLSNKPKINGVTLSGDKSTSDLGITFKGFSPEQLWSHSATTGVDAGSYPLTGIGSYTWFLVEFAANTSSTPSNRRAYTIARLNTMAIAQVLYSNYIYYRSVTVASDDGGIVAFTAGTRLSGTATADSANYCVPTRVWGIG